MQVVLQLLLGLVVGYLAASLIESAAHQHISDAPRRNVDRWKKHPRLLRHLIQTHYSHHTIHHVKTFRQDYVTQFRSEEEKAVLDAELTGRHGRLIRKANYAVKLQGGGALTFIAPLVAFFPVIWLVLGRWAAVGAVLTMALPPLLSNFVHPYLHKSHASALAESPRFLRYLLGTRYLRLVARHHFMHHRYQNCNFNLVLGGDWLRGVWRKPNEKDVAEMIRIGLPVD